MSAPADQPNVVEQPEQHLAVVRDRVAFADVPALYDRAYPAIFGALGAAGIAPSAPPMGVVHGSPDGTLDLSVAVPVAEPFTGDGEVTAETISAGRVATLLVRGDYSQIGPAYQRLFEWTAAQGLEATGLAWEQYLTEPQPGGDPAENETLVAIQLAD
ncbi:MULTISPECIES: GyrI-like domain-containing protein [unclassified Leucobacter]|uniref:GyrI-like domain-containing protein n=1 Tax=unclassified Leucobacter TaxID=2621730 RepID=UPI000622A6EF|nr:GyrI-like domain-containing protein [Leucobacter sp. Ag1]KKI16543.1 hypothetical protein XM48_15365 [Leucobacter sp. Ag1]